MIRKLLVVILTVGALFLVFAAVSVPVRAAGQTGNNQDPEPQASLAPDALPVFEARLTGSEVYPNPISTAATGRAVLVLDKNLTTVYYRVLVSNISAVTAASIRFGQPGESGAEVFPLFTSGTFDPDNPISGTLTLNANQVTELIVGNYYIDVRTVSFPQGEIRGQVGISMPPTRFNALMSGTEEVPPVDTPAAGVASFSLNASMDQLNYQITVSDISSITLAHLHTGWPGKTGPPVVPLFSSPGTFDPGHPLSGTVNINAQNLLDLLTGYLYANIHTTTHPAGEIRGQVNSGYFAFEADLAGENEVPQVNTAATGRAVMVLDQDLNTLYYRLAVSDLISATAAHIHLGAPGQNGPVVFPLYTGAGTFDEGHPISGSITFTDTEQVNNLLSGNYYVNVHTAAYPGGAIRGQLTQFTPERDYIARLTGLEEVPPTNSAGRGTASFTLSGGLNSLRYEVQVADIQNILMAHIHTGFPGQNGPPVIPLYSGQGAFDPANPLRGMADLSAQHLLDLLTGYLYINIHTQAFPEGEIRGQIQEQQGTTLYFPIIFKP